MLGARKGQCLVGAEGLGHVEPYGSSGSVQSSFDVLACVNVFGLFGTSKFDVCVTVQIVGKCRGVAT